ncbi:MAG TPA: methylated-DNA--[protein]-cysteine S-methyltransferase [Solirubrobacteraceae bacterium]|jgi:methylated-DNA-[protein]-cysteine S-methyltransferase|nr:methylated-DNA--[protein]-cysteine S-methyltransferase [Solirubrobacteraceae bacterium]
MTDLESKLRGLVRTGPEDASAGAARRTLDRAVSEGLADVCYASLDSPLGPLLAATTRRGVVQLAYEDGQRDALLERLAARLSPRVIESSAPMDDLRRQLEEYFAGERRQFQLELDWELTSSFGRRVLGHTARVPYGQVITYGEVAQRAGSPRGARAAGNALGANPMPIIVPCHRVLRTGGDLGGYGGGLSRKLYLLELEGSLLSC